MIQVSRRKRQYAEGITQRSNTQKNSTQRGITQKCIAKKENWNNERSFLSIMACILKSII